MPGGGENGCFSLRTIDTEEVDGLVMCIGQSDRYNQMTGTHVEGWMDQLGQMELFKRDFSTLLNLGFIFAILTTLFHFT